MMLLNENSNKKMKDIRVGVKALNIPTPLHRTSCLYHISASENFSLDPDKSLTH